MAAGRYKVWTAEAVVAELRKMAESSPDGYVTYQTAGGGLRAATAREFGSWQKACEAAGVMPRPRGRPRK